MFETELLGLVVANALSHFPTFCCSRKKNNTFDVFPQTPFPGQNCLQHAPAQGSVVEGARYKECLRIFFRNNDLYSFVLPPHIVVSLSYDCLWISDTNNPYMPSPVTGLAGPCPVVSLTRKNSLWCPLICLFLKFQCTWALCFQAYELQSTVKLKNYFNIF